MKARFRLDVMYQFMNKRCENNTWMLGDMFTMADCAALPPLAYAQKLHPFTEHPNIVAYFERLQARPCVQQVAKEIAPALQQWEDMQASKGS